MEKLKICTKCIENHIYGYGYAMCIRQDFEKCPKCGGSYAEANMSRNDALVIHRITDDWVPLLESMLELHDKDIIEYNIKMGQLRALDKPIVNEDDNKPHCPKCGSTEIQIVPRKWAPLTGILTNKTDRVCVNCKHKW